MLNKTYKYLIWFNTIMIIILFFVLLFALRYHNYSFKGDVFGSSDNLKLSPNSVSSETIKEGSISSEDVNTSQIQLRVNGYCPVGSISKILPNGSVLCSNASHKISVSLSDVLLAGSNAGGSTIFNLESLHTHSLCLSGSCISNWSQLNNYQGIHSVLLFGNNAENLGVKGLSYVKTKKICVSNECTDSLKYFNISIVPEYDLLTCDAGISSKSCLIHSSKNYTCYFSYVKINSNSGYCRLFVNSNQNWVITANHAVCTATCVKYNMSITYNLS